MKKNYLYMPNRFVGGGKKAVATFFAMFAAALAQAQDYSAGTAAIEEVTTGLTAYVPYVQGLIYIIAAIVAIIGAFSVFNSMTSGDQDVKKKIVMLVGACLFLVACASALPLFFGYSA